MGATVSILPTVEILPLVDFSQLDQTLARLDTYDWLVFTSANGVKAFVNRLRQTGKDLRALGRLFLAAIGPVTAATLESYYLTPDLVPTEYRSESLADALRERVHGQRVLLARADRGREVLLEQLQSVAEVRQVAVYRQVDVEMTPDQTSLFREGSGYITLTSSNIARSLLRQLDPTALESIRSGRIQLVSISPVTSAAIAEFGLPVAIEARDYTTAGLIAALRAHVAR
jgi:uroporphyrinogen III methyltransferase / synthase